MHEQRLWFIVRHMTTGLYKATIELTFETHLPTLTHARTNSQSISLSLSFSLSLSLFSLSPRGPLTMVRSGGSGVMQWVVGVGVRTSERDGRMLVWVGRGGVRVLRNWQLEW